MSMENNFENNPPFFWSLDSLTPPDIVEEYREALRQSPDSRLASWVRLMSARVPILPRAYLSSQVLQFVPKRIPESFLTQLNHAITRFERLLHRELNSPQAPLLVAVQGDYCGSVRNIGASPLTLPGLVHHYGAGRAYTLYIDFLESFSTLVLGCPHVDFRRTFEIKATRDGSAGELATLAAEVFLKHVKEYQSLVSQKVKRKFPERPEQQLLASVMQLAWAGKSLENEEIFIAAQIHLALYPNAFQGVAFTRNPFTGERDVYGVYMHGENDEKGLLDADDERKAKSLRERNPQAYAQIKMFLPAIEASFRDVIEAQFVTDEDGQLYFHEFEKAQTTARAAAISALELCRKGDLSEEQAARRIQPIEVESLLHATLDEQSRRDLPSLETRGITASPGTAVGHIFFRMNDAVEFYKTNAKEKKDTRVILAAEELLISDSPGIGLLSGLVTKASGIGSHAAVMARANNIPCIIGLKDAEFDSARRFLQVGAQKIPAGTLITLEAAEEGRIFLGEGRLQNLSHRQGLVKDIAQLMNSVARQQSIPLRIYANINNAHDAQTALDFGAEGVGLCRTENMFLEPEAMAQIREVIFSNDRARYGRSLDALEKRQFEDFKKIFEVLQGLYIQIRLMDLPLSEFAPRTDEELAALQRELPHLGPAELRAIIQGFSEHNPMLGLRACRFGLIRPEIYEMQLRAIFRAAYTVAATGVQVCPGIMYPLVVTEEELHRLRARAIEIEAETRELLKISFDKKIRFYFGTMIELPGAALQADRLAALGEFFAFGTNDLTQTTLGMSRDDAAHFLPFYLKDGLISADPFKVLAEPVKQLIDICVTRGRRVRRDATFGICGEQAGDKASLEFCLKKDIDYVSCSPFRLLPVRTLLVQTVLAAKNGRRASDAEIRKALAPVGDNRPAQVR